MAVTVAMTILSVHMVIPSAVAIRQCQTPMLRSNHRKEMKMTNQLDYMHLSYGEWYQTIEKPRLEAIPENVREANAASHWIGVVDECYACIKCECKSWNTWKVACPA